MASIPASSSIAGRSSTPSELMAELQLPPAIEPNSRFKYSNHGFGLIGLVIEAITEGALSHLDRTRDRRRRRFARNHCRHAAGQGHRASRAAIHPGFRWNGVWSFPATTEPMRWRRPRASSARRPMSPAIFAQLAPNAKRSVLSAASRREMTRRHWRNPHATGGGVLRSWNHQRQCSAAGTGSAIPADCRAISRGPP